MSRVWLVVAALFWGAMNVLLWRAEYGDSATLGSSLPVSVVWAKMLETPDASGLEIRQRGEKIGFCRWSVIQENPLDDVASFEESPGQDELDGMIENILGYQIQLEGNLSAGSDAGRYLRFGFSTHLKADAETWTESDLRIGKKGNWLQLATVNGSEALKVQHTYEGTHSELSFSFDDLKNPGALLQGLGLPPSTKQSIHLGLVSPLSQADSNDPLRGFHSRGDRYGCMLQLSNYSESPHSEEPRVS
ncbi:hypothetical protein OAH36_03545 [Verrucomicrobia bacterium]|nr:hypothetical protein [Verrucomicrobiota bacterium]